MTVMTPKIRLLTLLPGCVAALFVLAAPSAAWAAGPTLGQALDNMILSLQSFPFLVTTFSYIAGLFLAVWAMFGFKDHVDNPNQTPLFTPLKRLAAGGFFLALPFTLEAMVGLVMPAGAPGLTSTGYHVVAIGGPANLATIAAIVMDNVGPSLQWLLVAFSYIAGLIFAVIGISRLLKNMQDGPRGPAGIGTIMTFITAGALLSVGNLMATFSTSLFGSSQVRTFSGIGVNLPAPVNPVFIDITIEAVLKFIMLVGMIAFIRGLFVLRAAADGNGQVSLMQAFTFLIGGTLAINLGPLINAIVATLNLAGFGIVTPFN